MKCSCETEATTTTRLLYNYTRGKLPCLHFFYCLPLTPHTSTSSIVMVISFSRMSATFCFLISSDCLQNLQKTKRQRLISCCHQLLPGLKHSGKNRSASSLHIVVDFPWALPSLLPSQCWLLAYKWNTLGYGMNGWIYKSKQKNKIRFPYILLDISVM